MNRFLKIPVVLAALTAGLAGCASPEEIRQADAQNCASYGFQPNTTDFSTCLQREHLGRYAMARTPGPYWWGW